MPFSHFDSNEAYRGQTKELPYLVYKSYNEARRIARGVKSALLTLDSNLPKVEEIEECKLWYLKDLEGILFCYE